MKKTILVAFTALFLHACDSGGPSSPVAGHMADPEAVKRGRLVFAGTCGAYCHKLAPGQGGVPYLFDCGWKHGGSDQQIYATIRDGVSDTQMVGFGGVLPGGDDDIWKIVAYLRTNSTCEQ
ncbi:MAG TPA: hypothetical protein EYQ81_05050 [Sneathiellales bacterium]|nr:hypothetical protein [Sneathiellales bacterium]